MTEPQTTGRPTAAQSAGRPPCTATTQRGEACRGWALPGGSLCHMHEPARAERVSAGRSKGGRVTALHGQRRRLDSARSLAQFTSGVIQDVIDGTLTPETARVVLYGVSVQKSVIDATTASETEKRLGSLEELARRAWGTRWSA